MKTNDQKARERADTERKPLERPELEKLGELSRVVKQSGAITVSGGRA